jgi:hypothetical protein
MYYDYQLVVPTVTENVYLQLSFSLSDICQYIISSFEKISY